MGTKVTVDNVTNIEINSGVPTLNDNFDIVADEFDKVFYRDGSLSVTGNIDMDSNRLLNVPAPSIPTDVVRLQDLETVVDGAFLIQLNAKADIADVNAGLALKVDSADLSSEDGAELVGFSHNATYTKGTTGDRFKHEIWVTDDPFLADNTNTVDAAAAIRLAITLASGLPNGATVRLPEGQYRLGTSIASPYWTTSSGSGQVSEEWQVPIVLPANVGLVGAGSDKTTLIRTGGSIMSNIFLRDWKNAKLGGFKIVGPGKDNNSQHGIFNGSASTFDFVTENVEIFDIVIENVGSYGIGNQMQVRNVSVWGIRTKNTGADGIDWKIRLPNGNLDAAISESVSFDDIEVRLYGQRAGAGTPTGIGFRGRVSANNIRVFDCLPNQFGIDFTAGISTPANGDYRPSASGSTITNWYVQGADAKGANSGLRVYSSTGVSVGPGLAKWATVTGAPATASPYKFNRGATFTGVVCIPAHGRNAFEGLVEGTAFGQCKVESDAAYFDARRANLTAGQTVFNLPWDTTIANGVPRVVTKNGVTLTETTDYSWGSNSVTLASPVLVTDEIVVAFPPSSGVRIEADRCSVSGLTVDKFTPNLVSFATGSNANTSPVTGSDWQGKRGVVSEINSPTIPGLTVVGDATNIDFRLAARGAGALILGANSNTLGFFSSAGTTRPTVSGSRGSNAALTSLLTALANMNLINNTTT